MSQERQSAADQPASAQQSHPSPSPHAEQAAPVAPEAGATATAEATSDADSVAPAQPTAGPTDQSVWDPWAPPAPEPPVDHTQPVDLSHTQELRGMAGQSGPQPGADQAGIPAPVWATDATGWPAQETWPAHEGAPLPPPPGYGPVESTPGAWPAPPAPTQPGPTHRRQRRSPSWGAVVAIAAIAALVAAILGGIFGGWLYASDRVDFSSLDRNAQPIPQAGAGATARPQGSIASIAAKALPSVVTIKVKGADGAGTGSGFVLDHAGHIITNNHVVSGAADGGTIKVELSNGSEIEATIAGRDASYDLAVLKTGRSELQPLVMGSSKEVIVGDPVIAVGAPLGLESTVTAGIVSALNRPVSPGGDGDAQSYINAIQTDAAINPGNSGGPLLDMQGHVIGVNSAIARVPGSTDTQSGNIGVGFAIPSDQVVKTAEQLIKTGKAQHPIIGVVLDRQYTGDGVRILDKGSGTSGAPVSPGGPADKAGLRPGDVILEFDGRRVNAPDDLVVAIRAKNVGDKVQVKVRRGNETLTLTLTLSGTSGS